MHIIINELLISSKRVLKLYGFGNATDSKDKDYFEGVEISRKSDNIKRTMLFSIFVLSLIIISVLIPAIRHVMNTSFKMLAGMSGVLLVIFALVSQKYYEDIIKDVNKTKNIYTANSLCIFFWSIYFIMISMCFSRYDSAFQGTICWLIMLFVALSLPMFNRKEFFIVSPIAILSIVYYFYYSKIETRAIFTCIPIVFVLLIITQTNHMQRLEHFYDAAINHTESIENKRRLGKIFEEVFDMAFEFDIKKNTCYMLRQNTSYDMTGTQSMTMSEFMQDFKELTYEDDIGVVERNFTFTYLNSEFTMERSQTYFEMRIKNCMEEYRWISVLLTKENDSDNSDYLLCLIQDIEERKRNEDKLKLEAEKDPLTQLYNKMTTKSLIEECFEKDFSAQHALIIIDIDNFKTINDSRGHVVGDQILLAFAEQLNKNFRETDILGRAGGDEFIVLIKNVQSVGMVCDKLQRLTSSFKKYGIDHGFPGRLSTSIGVAMFNKDGKNYEELFKKADAALYEAKRNGKDQYKFSIARTEL